MATCTRNCESYSSHSAADWQRLLAESVYSPAELCRILGLDPALAAEAAQAAQGFSLLAPRPFVARIRPGDPTDPLLQQILPRAVETATAPGYGPDPLHEAQAQCGPGLLQKYQGRILMVTTGACGVHCRFCFRRHFRQKSLPPERERFEQALLKIAENREIHEVILSGGDPLTLEDCRLAWLFEHFAKIPHLKRVRIHSRMPIVIPQRITAKLIELLRTNRLTSSVVVHINHPAEIDDAVAGALGRLVDAGLPVMSQSVLLKGVNDRIEVLAELYERLVGLRVMPYYLHQLDMVAGAAHFEVPIAQGIALVEALRAKLPGYAVPRYVRETPGGTNKGILA